MSILLRRLFISFRAGIQNQCEVICSQLQLSLFSTLVELESENVCLSPQNFRPGWRLQRLSDSADILHTCYYGELKFTVAYEFYNWAYECLWVLQLGLRVALEILKVELVGLLRKKLFILWRVRDFLDRSTLWYIDWNSKQCQILSQPCDVTGPFFPFPRQSSKPKRQILKLIYSS